MKILNLSWTTLVRKSGKNYDVSWQVLNELVPDETIYLVVNGDEW